MWPALVFTARSNWDRSVQFPASRVLQLEPGGSSGDHQILGWKVEHRSAVEREIAARNDVLTERERAEREIVTIDAMIEEEHSQPNCWHNRYVEQKLLQPNRLVLIDQD